MFGAPELARSTHVRPLERPRRGGILWTTPALDSGRSHAPQINLIHNPKEEREGGEEEEEEEGELDNYDMIRTTTKTHTLCCAIIVPEARRSARCGTSHGAGQILPGPGQISAGVDES